MLVIGVTGNFGTGKTTVCAILAELGAVVINADNLGHELLESDDQVYRDVVVAFGDSILMRDKQINRKKLADLVFKDTASQAKLNAITHPVLYRIVKQKIEAVRRKINTNVVLEAALLIEANWKSLTDRIWVTVAPESVIVDRLKSKRGYSEDQILARLRTQMPQDEKVKYADIVIDTDCSRDELRGKVVKLWQQVKSAK